MKIELLYRQASASFLKRSGVLTPANLASSTGWQITDKGLRRFVAAPNNIYFVESGMYGGRELTWHEFHAISLRKLKREGVEYAFLEAGKCIDPSPIMPQIQARIELDARLTAALGNALCVGRSPYYGDAQYESEEGFIHQTGGGRLSLCTEAEHIRWIEHYWIEHYEAVRASYDQFWARQQEIKDAHQRGSWHDPLQLSSRIMRAYTTRMRRLAWRSG